MCPRIWELWQHIISNRKVEILRKDSSVTRVQWWLAWQQGGVGWRWVWRGVAGTPAHLWPPSLFSPRNSEDHFLLLFQRICLEMSGILLMLGGIRGKWSASKTTTSVWDVLNSKTSKLEAGLKMQPWESNLLSRPTGLYVTEPLEVL